MRETHTNAGVVTKETVNVYSLENRLAESTVTRFVAGTTNVTHCTFTYNHEGTRVSKVVRTTVDGVETGVSTNLYLLDSFNQTGYAQVLEEKSAADAAPSMAYTIGDDVMAQTRAAADGLPATTDYMLHDGHGSTRALADAAGEVKVRYGFDAYGVLLGSVAGAQAKQATSSLYCGEQFDHDVQQYYLRARYYNQQNGRFSALDPFAGSPEDPQSLHKYAYCGADPVNAVDPSGRENLANLSMAQLIQGRVLSVLLQVTLKAYNIAFVTSMRLITWTLNQWLTIELMLMGVCLTVGVAEWTDQAIEKLLKNTDEVVVENGSVGSWMENKLAANAADDYEVLDHVIEEDGTKHLVSLGSSASDSPDRQLNKIAEKVERMNEGRERYEPRNKNSGLPVIKRDIRQTRTYIHAVPENSINVLKSNSFRSGLRALQAATRVRIIVVPLRGWINKRP